MNYTAYLYKYLIGYCAEAMGLCMGAMAEEKDPAAAAELAKHCAAYAMMINVYAQRMASIAGEAAGASTDPETAEEEMKAQLSFIPEETTRGEVAKAALAAKRCGFRVGEVIAQVAALTGYEDPVQFKAGLLKLGEELQALRTQTAAQAPVLTAVAAVAGAGSPEEQAGKLAAQAQTLAALQALQPVVAKAQVLTTKTDPAEVAAGLEAAFTERASLQGEIAKRDYDAEFALCRAEHKIVGAAEEAWVRENVKTLAALKQYRASKTPAHIAQVHQEPTQAQLDAAQKQAQEQEQLAQVQLTAQEEAALALSAGGLTPAQAAERRQQFIQRKAERLAAKQAA